MKNISVRQIFSKYSQSGFLLLELLISIMIAIMGMMSLYYWQAQNLITYKNAFKTMEMIFLLDAEKIFAKANNVIKKERYVDAAFDQSFHRYCMKSFARVFDVEVVPNLNIRCVSIHWPHDSQQDQQECLKIVELAN